MPGANPGDVGLIPIGRAIFRRAVDLSYRQKQPRAASRFKPCATRQRVDDSTRLLSVTIFRADDRRLSSSNGRALRSRSGSGFESREIRSQTLPDKFSTTGRRIGLSLTKHVVAGSNPAPGTRRQGSSAVEHVIPSSIFIRRVF